MRVLHVIPSVARAHGGPTEAMELIELSLHANGVSVTTVTTDDAGPGRRMDANARLAVCGGARRIYFRKVSEFYKIAPGIMRWLWQNVRSFDIVHIHALFSFTSVVAAVVANWRGVPYVLRPLGTLSKYGRERRRPWLKKFSIAMIESQILRRASAVHFTSSAEWEEAKLLGVPMRAVIIPLGLRAKAETGEGRAQEYATLVGRHILLFLSRLDPKKNLEGLLHAVAKLKGERDDFALLIAGDGVPTYVDQLKSLARSLSVESNLVWLGHVEGSRKAGVLAMADIFVLPSLSENFGFAAAEAMLAGLPSVLGQGIAIAAQAEAAGAAIMVKPDPEEIGRALADLLANQEQRHAMRRRARDFAAREFSSHTMAQRLTSLYQKISDPKLAHVTTSLDSKLAD